MENKEYGNIETKESEETELPPCQISSTAEHSRWDEEDGPCDDGRGGHH
jgi:hypothetical protein